MGSSPWVPKIPLAQPAFFTGDKPKEEDVTTWLREVPTYVRTKGVSVDTQVIVAASYLKGSAAKWLNGLVVKDNCARDFEGWCRMRTLEAFAVDVETRWRNPQQGQQASDALARLESKRFNTVRDLTNYVDKQMVVPGVEYNLQVLLTSFVRSCPVDIRKALASDTSTSKHDYSSLSQKALEMEATLDIAQPSSDGRKKSTSQQWRKKGGQLLFIGDEDTFSLTGEETEESYDDAVEEFVAAAPAKAKSAGRGKGQPKGSSKKSESKASTTAPGWVKVGIDKDVWTERFKKGKCTNCGQYGHLYTACKNAKVNKIVPWKLDESHTGASSSGNTSGQ
jgi:hypothetical protein